MTVERWAFLILGAACALATLNICAVSLARHPGRISKPEDSASLSAEVALGRRLFYDADLSADGTISCATCHEQKRGFADGNRTHSGVGGVSGRRNVPGLANVAFLPVLTSADPRQRSLEVQALVPIFGTHPVEMGMAEHDTEISRRLSSDSCYRTMFASAFPSASGVIDLAHVTLALAAFERQLLSFHAPYDAWLAGRRGALSPAAQNGWRTFSTSGCSSCHSGPDLTDGAYHRIESQDVLSGDRGLAEITGRSEDQDKFRTPSLRDVSVTGPYLHDGSATTIAQAIRRHAVAKGLDDRQVSTIAIFLSSLTDQHFLRDRRLSLPSKACGRHL